MAKLCGQGVTAGFQGEQVRSGAVSSTFGSIWGIGNNQNADDKIVACNLVWSRGAGALLARQAKGIKSDENGCQVFAIFGFGAGCIGAERAFQCFTHYFESCLFGLGQIGSSRKDQFTAGFDRAERCRAFSFGCGAYWDEGPRSSPRLVARR